MAAREWRGDWVLPFSMFLGSFAWSFVFVSLPFYILKMSTVDAAATLRWTGWILGISSLVTVVTAPFSARFFGERNPKRSFIFTQLLQGGGFFLMALARTLPELFFSRMLLGFMGAVSTFAFIMVGRSGRDVRRGIASIQSGMTLGQVLGPAAGALAAARIGFRFSFVAAGLMLWACSALVAWGVPHRPVEQSPRERPQTASVKEVATVCLLVLAGSTQVFFLTAILPQVLQQLGVETTHMLEVSGFLLLATGAAAAIGAMLAPRVGEIVGDRRTIVWFLAASSLGLAALAAAPGVWSFGVLRFLQVLCIAPVFPLSVAAIAQRASGTAIGIVNSSRIAAAFLGPVIATTLLTWMPPGAVYLVLAGMGLLVVPLLAGLSGPGAYPPGAISKGGTLVKQDQTAVRVSEVRMEGVGKRYGAAWAVKDVSIYIRPGEFYTLLGPSGCGKTTLLRMLAGFAQPDEGRILVDDEPIDSVPPWKRNLGMVFQHYALWPHMSVFENVAFGLRERRVSGAELDRKVKAALEQVGLEGFDTRRPSQLSGGQQQRVALARTLIVQPRLLLLDEPLSNLDAQLRSQMRLELARLHKDVGITTLYVTHDQAEALSLSTRIAVLSNGALVQEGRPEEIYWKPRNAFVAEFVGAANLVPVTVLELREMGVVIQTRGGARLPVSSGGHAWSVGDRALLCLRPEALRIEEAERSAGGIPGTVAAHVFEGSRQLYDVTIPGGTIKVEMITSALVGKSFMLGDKVRVEVSPETSVLLPDEKAAA